MPGKQNLKEDLKLSGSLESRLSSLVLDLQKWVQLPTCALCQKAVISGGAFCASNSAMESLVTEAPKGETLLILASV